LTPFSEGPDGRNAEAFPGLSDALVARPALATEIIAIKGDTMEELGTQRPQIKIPKVLFPKTLTQLT
jgi:hypothetical protein